jgi:hypothetical protein
MATLSKTITINSALDGQVLNLSFTSSNEVLDYFQHTYALTTTEVPIFESNVQTGNRSFDIAHMRIENKHDVTIVLKVTHETGNPTFIEVNIGESFVLSSLIADNSTTGSEEKITKIEAVALQAPTLGYLRVVHAY